MRLRCQAQALEHRHQGAGVSHTGLGLEDANRCGEGVGQFSDAGVDCGEVGGRQGAGRRDESLDEVLALPAALAHQGESIGASGAGEPVERLAAIAEGGGIAGRETHLDLPELGEPLGRIAQILAAKLAILLSEVVIGIRRQFVAPGGVAPSRYGVVRSGGDLAAKQVPDEGHLRRMAGEDPARALAIA